MTDEQIRTICLEAATKNYQPGRLGGFDLLSDATRMFDWVKTGKLAFTVVVGSGGAGGRAGGAGGGSMHND